MILKKVNRFFDGNSSIMKKIIHNLRRIYTKQTAIIAKKLPFKAYTAKKADINSV